ncbi:MAG: hypothetical protein ACYSWO_24170 [Planctomycetota bacterium]|jgi:hypothetical protein
MSVNKLLAIASVLLLAVPVSGKLVIQWDFSEGLHGWAGNNKVEKLTHSSQGLSVKSTGEDPWIEGPAIDLPGGDITRVKIRMKSTADAAAELFYGPTFRAGHSVRFTVRNDGKWHDYSLVIRESLGPGTRFRLDPCMNAGDVTVASIDIETISRVAVPDLQKPRVFGRIGGSLASVRSGGLEFVHFGGRWGKIALTVNGVEMASGCDSELIGMMLDDRAEWLSLKKAELNFLNQPDRHIFTTIATIEDSEGGKWEIRRTVSPASLEGTLLVETQLTVDSDRDILHFPWLTIFPGLGTFGERKSQGLFAGLEYLCDEPSSSMADITTPDHVRRVPDPIKITFPLMAISQAGNYIGVIWEPSETVAATFDSPDRIYDSGAHVMALSAPGVSDLRFENDFCAHTPLRLKANKPFKNSVLIIGGKGKTIVPAVQHYASLRGLPYVPTFEGGFDAAVTLLAHGWLDSQINEDALFRHAVWGENFLAGQAADAAMFIDWLAIHTRDQVLRERLDYLKRRALDKIPPTQPFSSSVSHAHLPNAPLVFGRTIEFVQQRHDAAWRIIRSFDAAGVKRYRKGRDKPDYSTTHFAKHANGLAGRDMVAILEAATLSGDKELIREALELLDKQTALYANTVPRGAQTWEIPLHTPDILASAHMVKAYTLGYIISEREEYLQQARYWAWTGVPFVYLYPPTPQRVGSYSTISVLGATNWKAPLWLGQPVQWCGLVYSSALYLLSEYDRQGPWRKIADGITTVGLQMTWGETDDERLGLLPDYFDFRAQVAGGPAINPGTVQAHLPELYGVGTMYDVKKVPGRGWFIHAPCTIGTVREDDDAVTVTIDGWGQKSYHLLISGMEQPHEVRVQSQEPSAVQFDSKRGILVANPTGKSKIRIE